MNPTILTHAGIYYDLTKPEEYTFRIETIAHALSNICRFTGHTSSFYSVAQHSVLVSRIVPPEHALAGLLHDATEAFMGDVSRPLKLLLPAYQDMEERLQAAILTQYGLAPVLPASVKRADCILLVTEKRDLMPDCGPWPGFESYSPLTERITPWSPEAARIEFLRRFEQLVTADAV